MSLKPYFQLVRLPNLFTAAADSLAGWLLVRGTLSEPGRWVPLALASMAIYAAGIALNDLFDLEIDRVERPKRPLPSGAVAVRFAAILSVTLLVVGFALACLGGVRSAIVAAALIACVLAYDVGAKRTAFGPELMGACRGLNVTLGLSAVDNLGGPTAWLAAASIALFVTGITWISRSETESGRSSGSTAGWVLQNVAFIGLVVAAFRPGGFPSSDDQSMGFTIFGLAILGIVAVIVNRADLKSVTAANPIVKQLAVKTGVLSLVWLNVAIVAAIRGPALAAAVAVLWIPAFLLGKWLYST
jgi:4-hydroxybenzoate polyprenyltransferase